MEAIKFTSEQLNILEEFIRCTVFIENLKNVHQNNQTQILLKKEEEKLEKLRARLLNNPPPLELNKHK